MRMDDPRVDAPHSRSHILAPAPSRVSRVAPEPWSRRFAEHLLSGPLTAALLGLALVQVATWLPHYLTWPYWADHDVFATAARGWTRGTLPYRDTLGNNFPGTIYLFLALGLTAGWGRPWALYAFDAALLLTLGGMLVVWSRRRFGTGLPGVIGWLPFLSYALSLDYSHAAQRDWHAPAAAVLGLLFLQSRFGRAGRVAAGLLAAAAVSVRPQAVLFLPAFAVALREEALEDESPTAGGWECAAAFAVGVALAFAPLAAFGVLDDFVRGVRLAAYGSTYSEVTPALFLKNWVVQAATARWLVIVAGSLLLGAPFTRRTARTSLPWLAALAGVSVYRPMSPVAHSYLDIPLELVGAVATAALAGIVLDAPRVGPEFRLAAVLLALGLGPTTLRPDFCVAGPTARAVVAWVRGTPFTQVPPGYRKGRVNTSASYRWADYQALITYLRTRTPAETPVANLLRGDPALTSVSDRPSALPAESITWLRMVRPQDEARFAQRLLESHDARVVWVPGETGPHPSFRLDQLTAVVRSNFRPETRFGEIEVWRRVATGEQP